MFIRLALAVSVLMVTVAAPASAHVAQAGADLRLAQTIEGTELTVVIRRVAEVPGPLQVDLVVYQPVHDLAIDLAVDESTGTVRLHLTRRHRP